MGFSKNLEELQRLSKRVRPQAGRASVVPSYHEAAVAIWEAKATWTALNGASSAEFERQFRLNPQLTVSFKAWAYANAQGVTKLKSYLWSKKEALADAIDGAVFCLNGGLLVPALTLVRSALEQIADLHSLTASTHGHADKSYTSPLDRQNATTLLLDTIHKHLMATKIDIKDFTENPILGGKRKSYKADERFSDISAQSVLNSIDVLDKTVKGSRRGYEFLCEFAHPNTGAFLLSRSRKAVVQKKSPLTFVETAQGRSTPSLSLEAFQLPLLQSFDLLLETGRLFERDCVEMDRLAEHLVKYSKDVAKVVLRNYAPLWNRDEPCPCLSGLNIANCCGKKLFRT